MLYLRCITEDPLGAPVPPLRGSQLSLSLCTRVYHPNTRRHVRLLGPCFKTGRLKPLCQYKHRRSMLYHSILTTVYEPRLSHSKRATFLRTFSSDQHRHWPVHKEMRQTKVRLSPSRRD